MMPIFATPDFGASAGIGCFLLIGWALVLVLVGVGIVRGMKLVESKLPKARRHGVCLVVVSALLPLCCCMGPSQVVRLVYGNYPIGSYPDNKILKGMTTDEVVAILGTPHERLTRGDKESWYYWIDSFGMRWFGVDFGPEGRVVATYGN